MKIKELSEYLYDDEIASTDAIVLSNFAVHVSKEAQDRENKINQAKEILQRQIEENLGDFELDIIKEAFSKIQTEYNRAIRKKISDSFTAEELANEHFEPIPDDDDYEISNLGRIKNRWGNVSLGSLTPDGYLRHTYKDKDGKSKLFFVHRMVAIVHKIENDAPEHKTVVNHKDENKMNNRVDNLEWTTPQENTIHGTAIERKVAGSRKKVACYLNNDLVNIFDSLTEAGEWMFDNMDKQKYKASSSESVRSVIGNNLNGRNKSAYGHTWKYVDD